MQKFKKIDQYQLMEILGKGANGLVYKGLNTIDGSLVAVKEIFIGKSQIKSIKTELQLLKDLYHPNIVKFIDAIQKQNKIYLILQYVQGGSLAALVRKSVLQQDVAKIYVKQILCGLAFLHRKQVIHRDIKGANILLTKNGMIKLADFGVAVRLQENQKTISAAGSPYWMAPQIITSATDQPSVKCDIWSLGCTLIELLTGNPPYHDLLQFPALFRIVEDKHPPLPQCSQQCKQFLLSCFQKNPKNRASAEELINSSWLKNINEVSIKKIEWQQNTINQKMILSIKPYINYEQLQRLLEIVKNIKLIYKNKYFNAVIQDKRIPNYARTQFINNLMQKDENSIVFLCNTGVLSFQFEKLRNRLQSIEQSNNLLDQMIMLFIRIYGQKIKHNQIHNNLHNSTQNKQYLDIQLLQQIILEKCIPSLSKLIALYSKNKKHQLKACMLSALNEFLKLIPNNQAEKDQILIQIIQQLDESGSFKQILNLNQNNWFQSEKNGLKNNSSQTYNTIYAIKLQILEKILPLFGFIMQINNSFANYTCIIVFQLLKTGLLCKNQVELATIVNCIKFLLTSDFSKLQLQRNGFLFHLTAYYMSVCENLKNISLPIVFSTLQCLINFFHNKKGGFDKNRINQFQRYNGVKYLKIIYQYLKNSMHQKQKQDYENPVIQKINELLKLFYKYIK